MSPLTCKRCGGGAALRGAALLLLEDGWSGVEECDAPLHSAAQRVVEAAVRMIEEEPLMADDPVFERMAPAVAALLAAREEAENAE